MNKNTIHNFNISIENSADIQSSEQLAKNMIKELAKVSKEISQQKDIEQLWQEQKDQNANLNLNASAEEGAVDTNAAMLKKTTWFAGTTSSVSGGNIPPNTMGNIFPLFENSSISDTLNGTAANIIDKKVINSDIAASVTPQILRTNESIAQLYGFVGQQNLTVPQIFQTNINEPSIEDIKAEIKKKLDLVIASNDTEGVQYWTRISKAFDNGAIVADFADKPEEILFTQMYVALKKSMFSPVEIQNFNWDNVRKKMIEAININILTGTISQSNKKRWEIIKNLLANDKTNVANLFEQYDELFLLLKEVEGLGNLPTTITITTKTKIYPNLSADKLYACIGKEDVYAFLKQVSETNFEGSAVNKGAVNIKTGNATTFIVGESLEFFIDETFINQMLHQKENINWVVYNGNTKKEAIFKNEGTSFSYNFDLPGTYRIDAYGQNHTIKQKKGSKTATFIEVAIAVQDIVITSPANINGEFTRPFAEKKSFKVSLKNTALKTLNPLKLYYQIEIAVNSKTALISEERELDATGIIKLAMPDFGIYKIKVASKDQYGLVKDFKVSVIKNEVVSIGLTEKGSSDNVFLLGNVNSELNLETKTFKINPPTDEEKEDVKWMVYDSNNKPYLAPGTVLFTNKKDSQKTYIHKWSSFIMPIPQKVGNYIVEAFSDCQKGAKAQSVYTFEVKQPEITEAYWAWSDSSKKNTSGFSGESNWIKATIPHYENQIVRIYFYLNNKKTNYYVDTKTNENGILSKEIKFDSNFKKLIGFPSNGTAKAGFKLLGIQNAKPHAFKTPVNYESDTALSVTTDKKILDVFFRYDGKRVTKEDEIPFGKNGAVITIVAKTQNMTGDEITLKAHKINEKPSFTIKVIVNSEGVAASNFILKNMDKKLKNGTQIKYYAGVVGYSTKHLDNKVLVMIVGEGKKKTMFNLTWGSKVSQDFREKVIEICADLWPDNTIEMANGLMAVMYRETNKTFAANQMAGYKSLISRSEITKEHFENIDKETGKMGSRAIGLIQFTQAALVSMKEFENGQGFDKLHKLKLEYANMTEIQQLEKVRKYFKNVARLPKVPEDIYVAIFSPDFVDKKSSETLYNIGTDKYKANPGLDKNNDGIQKSELLTKYYESLKEGNKNSNIARVGIEKNVDVCVGGKCSHYADVVANPKINNQSNNIDKNRWHRLKRYNNDHPQGYYHTGVDILAKLNTSLKSLLCGKVVKATNTGGDLGIIVIVKSKDKDYKDIWIQYCHLSSTSVKVGQNIKHGEEIGLSGNTGNAATISPKYYHVHIEASTDGVFYGGKTRVDPELYMKTKF